MSISFGVMAVGLIVQKAFICGTARAVITNCPVPPMTAYLELVSMSSSLLRCNKSLIDGHSATIVADVWLLGAPVYLVLHVKLPSNHSRLLASIFATAVLTTAASVTHCVYIFRNDNFLVGITAYVEVCVYGVAVMHVVLNITSRLLFRSSFAIFSSSSLASIGFSGEASLPEIVGRAPG